MLWAAFTEGCLKRKNLEEESAVREAAEPRSLFYSPAHRSGENPPAGSLSLSRLKSFPREDVVACLMNP